MFRLRLFCPLDPVPSNLLATVVVCVASWFSAGGSFPGGPLSHDATGFPVGTGSLWADGPEDANPGDLDPKDVSFFETKIRPVLVRECYGCHSDAAGNIRGGLRLDNRQRTLIGGTDGPAVVPGDPESSTLYLAIAHEGYEMPPNKKLSDQVREDFRRWISMGAPDPRQGQTKIVARPLDPAAIAQAKRDHWSYQAVQPHDAPEVSDADWPWNTVDQFALAKLESAGLRPADDCPPNVLIRRLTFDLIGLPPEPAEVAAFVAACRKDRSRAIENAVDRLLGSPEFGRRWGRHWMDVVRYAESTGSAVNMTYPHAWRYRDYIIDSYNDDKPFDEFLREQIAGDLLPAADDEQWAEQLVATTFLAIGPKAVNENNTAQFQADMVDEQIDAVGKAFLAQSIACARCHDHKFDPIGQTDYYAMAGMFLSSKTYFGTPPTSGGVVSAPQNRQLSTLLQLPGAAADPVGPRYSRQEVQQMRAEVDRIEGELAGIRRSGNPNALQQRIRLLNELSDVTFKLGVLDDSGIPRSYTMGVQDRTEAVDAPFLQRGEIDARGPAVPRAIPVALACQAAPIEGNQSGRLQMARDFSSPHHPLTARVYVNRVWAHLFGRGIVASIDNFGTTGEAPSHPELLDQLAFDFVNQNWSTKTLVKRLVSSRLYQTQSTYDAQSETIDPDNRWVWRRTPKRLDAEAIRDAMLSAGGVLQTHSPVGSTVARVGYTRVRGEVLGNPRTRIRDEVSKLTGVEAMARARGGDRSSVMSRMSATQRRESFRALRNFQSKIEGELDGVSENTRSVYLPQVRDVAPRSLSVFDLADSNRVLGDREISHTADQALYMMNNPLVLRSAQAMADRVCAEQTQTYQRIQSAFEIAYARRPSSRERSGSARFIASMASDRDIDPWTIFCQSLIAGAEFRVLD